MPLFSAASADAFWGAVCGKSARTVLRGGQPVTVAFTPHFNKKGLVRWIKQRVDFLEVADLGLQADKSMLFVFKQKSNACAASWSYKPFDGLNSRVARAILLKLICCHHVSRLVLTHKDRLLRFGSELLFKLCDFYDTEIIILDAQTKQSFEQELASDVIEIMTVFTAKMHGRRSHQNKRACQDSLLKAA